MFKILVLKKIIKLIKSLFKLPQKTGVLLTEIELFLFFKFQNEKFGAKKLLNEIHLGKNLSAMEPFYLNYVDLKTLLYLENLYKIKDLKTVVPDFYLISGISPEKDISAKIIKAAKKNKRPCFIIEDSFLRSVQTVAQKNCAPELKQSVSITLDNKSCHYDGSRKTYIEELLNNEELSQEEIKRARNAIDFITKNHITKYNHQPIYTPKIGRDGVKKILVVDQSYGDYSIKGALASDKTFDKMLKYAIKENPDADILVKTHPDALTGGLQKGYYTGLKQKGNIYPITDEINPISLLNYVDKVYVVSTQLGFEALLCNKPVVCFGLPFYSNWGLTDDKIKCKRRKKSRTLEEIFYLAYIKYSLYTNPKTEKKCEIEDALEFLLKEREEFFKEGAK